MMPFVLVPIAEIDGQLLVASDRRENARLSRNILKHILKRPLKPPS